MTKLFWLKLAKLTTAATSLKEHPYKKPSRGQRDVLVQSSRTNNQVTLMDKCKKQLPMSV
jgi:hypothetical protein